MTATVLRRASRGIALSVVVFAVVFQLTEPVGWNFLPCLVVDGSGARLVHHWLNVFGYQMLL